MHSLLLVVVLAVPLKAQSSDSTAPEQEVPINRVRANSISMASLGAAAGLYGGALLGGGPFYDITGCCGGGDDPGLLSALVGAAVGGVLGSALAVYLVNRPYGMEFETPITYAVVLFLPSVLVGAVGGRIGEFPGFVVGYSLSQGVFTTLFSMRQTYK